MSNLESKISIISRKKISDQRGWFLKVIEGKENHLPKHTGEIYIVSGMPGESRGGHYHNKAVEWFTLIEGNAVLRLQDIQTGEKKEIELSDDKPVTVFVPQYIAHVFVNRGNAPFVVIAYTDQLYKPDDTIQYILR